ncbi:ABC transporter ATP-binding protein [Devosia nitrariae]|nr:ABC transporter ATP-binding protein [Devosia nitrariae]
MSLDIAAGEFVTFLGPSGCGKSTTLKMLSGLLPQDSGEIRFGHKRIDMLPPNKRNIGLVFQNYALFPHMSVAENIAFGLRMRGWSRAAKDKRVDQLLQLVRLEGLGGRKPEQLSGGQQQRVAVARALAFNPDLVLLDEPLSNLDAKLREQVRLDLRDIQREANQTTIFVTHDQVEALVMSDRIVLMNKGGVEQVGTPYELYATPTTEFGARFVGANNLVAATLDMSSGTAQARIGADLALPITTCAADLDKDGTTIWFCVRPEHLALRPWNKEGEGQFAGRVLDKIYQGTTVLVDLDVTGLGTIRAERAALEVGDLPIGAYIGVHIERSHAVARSTG